MIIDFLYSRSLYGCMNLKRKKSQPVHQNKNATSENISPDCVMLPREGETTYFKKEHIVQMCFMILQESFKNTAASAIRMRLKVHIFLEGHWNLTKSSNLLSTLDSGIDVAPETFGKSNNVTPCQKLYKITEFWKFSYGVSPRKNLKVNKRTPIFILKSRVCNIIFSKIYFFGLLRI